MWTCYIALLTVSIWPMMYVVTEQECEAKGECTSMDGSTCVPVGKRKMEGCNTYKCLISGNVPTYMFVRSLSKCQTSDMACMVKTHKPMPLDNNCAEATCRPVINPDESFTMEYYERATGCLMENSYCMARDEVIAHHEECAVKKCTFFKYRTGSEGWKIETQHYGCPQDGECMVKNSVIDEDDNCATKICINNGTENILTWKINNQGCRSEDGTCYHHGDTWTEESCFTFKCNVEKSEDGEIDAVTSVVGGLCTDDYGMCRTYGETMTTVVDGVWYPACVCEKTMSNSGIPIGNPSCPGK